MDYWLWAMLLKPFVWALVCVIVVAPLIWLTKRFCPNWLQSVLLFETNNLDHWRALIRRVRRGRGDWLPPELPPEDRY